MAVILRYFSEFAYLPGVLRKSSRSLSHLLMSSCYYYRLCILYTNNGAGVLCVSVFFFGGGSLVGPIQLLCFYGTVGGQRATVSA